MDIEHNDEQVADSRQIKTAGQNAKVLFVVFVFTLFTLGAPLGYVADSPGGRSLFFNVLSIIGALNGVFAMKFLLRRRKAMMLLPQSTKILGQVGAYGLTAHTLIAIMTTIFQIRIPYIFSFTFFIGWN